MPLEPFMWRGKPVLPSRTAQDELDKYGIDLYKVVEVLKDGFDCARSRRAAGTYERCLTRGRRVLKIVVVDVGPHWLITHAGTFTLSKAIKKLRRQTHGTEP